MTKSTEEALALVEKVTDTSIKIGSLSVLGIDVPSFAGEVGLIGAAFSVLKIASHIRDQQFESSFQKFHLELETLTDEQKLRFFNRFSKKKVEDFGQQAILLLNKIEMPLAAKMMGKAHYLLVLDEISEDEYFNYCHIIKNVNTYLFRQITEIYGKNILMDFSGGVYTLLSSLGIVNEVPTGNFPSNTMSATEYSKSEFGKLFYERIIEPFLIVE